MANRALVVNLALPAFAAERRAAECVKAAPPLPQRDRQTDRQTERRADTVPLNKPCSAYYDKTTDLYLKL